MPKGKLYLCPITISERSSKCSVPAHNAMVMEGLELFFVEKTRTARRALRQICQEKDLAATQFVEIGKYFDSQEVEEALKQVEAGSDAGIMSEAGCPSIADPGRNVVLLAQRRDIAVVPLIGPSSILLALMASGQNGQQFAFVGYLPRDAEALQRKVKELVKRAAQTGEAQIFIETPYRNQRLFEILLTAAPTEALLTVAVDITSESESILTRPIARWRKEKVALEEKPTIFILGTSDSRS